MSDVYLGVIALAVAVMAVIQVAAIVFAARAARRVGDAVARLEEDVRPIVASFRSMSGDAARATSLATAQVERAERLFEDFTRRLEDTMAAFQATVSGPAREAVSILQALKVAIAAFRAGGPAAPTRKRPAGAEEDDALFIG